MKKLVYALFNSHDDAEKAVYALHDQGVPTHGLGVMIYEGNVDEHDLPLSATESKHFAKEGAFVGGAMATLLGGVVAAPLGVVGLGVLVAAGIAGGAGTALGAIANAVSGAHTPKPEFETIIDSVRSGAVLVTVDTTDARAGLNVEELLQESGGHEVGML